MCLYLLKQVSMFDTIAASLVLSRYKWRRTSRQGKARVAGSCAVMKHSISGHANYAGCGVPTTSATVPPAIYPTLN